MLVAVEMLALITTREVAW